MRQNIFFERCIEALSARQKKDPVLYGWDATLLKKTGYQELLYPAKTGKLHNFLIPDTIRFPIEEKSYRLSVFSRYGSPLVMGSASISLDPLSPIEEQLDFAIESARSVSNTPWLLVDPSMVGRPVNVKRYDKRLACKPAQSAQQIRIKANKCFGSMADTMSVNYAELFLWVTDWYTCTGTGLSRSGMSSDIYFEAAAEKLPLPNTQEVHINTSSLSLHDLDIGSFCEELETEVASLGNTELPDTDENACIIVHADAASDILHCLLSRLDAGREYSSKPFFKKGDPVNNIGISPDSDKLTVMLDPFRNYMAESASYTFDGLIPHKAIVIEDNIVKQRFVSNRIGQYLGMPVNPVIGNIVIGSGSHSYKELIKSAPKVIEIKSFSSLLLNDDYLTYSSEIKLAKEYDNRSGRTRLLKGGVVSGNIAENFSSFFMSREKTRYNRIDDGYSSAQGYIGPKYMIFNRGVTISGK
jgi:predicted Zn-dependent protease